MCCAFCRIEKAHLMVAAEMGNADGAISVDHARHGFLFVLSLFNRFVDLFVVCAGRKLKIYLSPIRLAGWLEPRSWQ